MSRKVIAIAGEAGAGKDVFSEIFLTEDFKHGSFAANLKKMCQEIFNLAPNLTNTQEGKKQRLDVPRRFTNKNFILVQQWMARTHNLKGLTPAIKDIENEYINMPVRRTGKPREFRSARDLLQFVGTDVCRRLIPTYHIDVLAIKIENSTENYIITDARFENERKSLKVNFNAFLVRIKRPNYVEEEGSKQHSSENSLGEDSEYDLVLLNDESLEKFKEKAQKFYEESIQKVREA